MQQLIIKKTEETPAIILNPNKKAFQFVATSWPENAKNFYEPIIEWINAYFEQTPLDETIFQFRYTYFNTASAKQIAKILTLLKHYSEKFNIVVQWFYEEDDYDMKREGKRFSAILNFKFEYIER